MYRLAIVDDSEMWCFVLALQLQQQGYSVATFTNAQSFLPQANQFDLVLVDFLMPAPRHQCSMDGPEVIAQVKQQLRHPPLLILVSGFFTEGLLDDIAAICPEADAILCKQTDMTEMFTTIQQLLVRQSRQQRQGSHAGAKAERDG